MLWRVGSWNISPAASLNLDEGLRIGTEAPEIAAHAGDQERHLSFRGEMTFLLFGTLRCEPCGQLLTLAPRHPATKQMRLVYVLDEGDTELDPEVAEHWEVYRFDSQAAARETWRAPVSPYFHVIGPEGRVQAKGIANRPDHLDRLLSLRPPVLSS